MTVMNDIKKVELLAPAGDKECAIAAIESGADAVYIGASSFGARRKAPNSLEDIKEIVDYAHKFYVKVHVTVNTILTDNELSDAVKLIHKLYNIGVDTIIVQDMGLLKLAVEGKLPPIPLHASTQCDNRTLEKAKFFEEIGVSRVILARELSLEKIKEISSKTEIELETFIHGALCVSYSGQCYMSAAIGGRSANRGECAQPCRKKYKLVDEDGNVIAKDKYLLCLKDFNVSSNLKDLIDVGVRSFKIEGRLKNADYVKNVVAYYRKEIDKYCSKTSSGDVFLDFEPDVNKSFNRGFTDYFLEKRKKGYNFDTPKAIGENLGKVKKIGRDYFEIDFLSCSKDSKLNPQDGICFFDNGDLKGCLVNKFEEKKVYPNKMDGIKVGMTVYRNQNAQFNKQLSNSKTKRRIKVNFEVLEKILRVTDEDNNSVEILFEGDDSPKNIEKMKENLVNQLKKTGESDFYVNEVVINSTQLPFMPISTINELRRTILKKLMAERLKNYSKQIQNPLKYAQFPQEKSDYHSNVHNEMAKEFYKNCGCEITEMSVESTGNYKNKTLMHTKHCLKFAFDMCKSPKKLFLTDEKGKKYKLEFDCKNCEMKIEN